MDLLRKVTLFVRRSNLIAVLSVLVTGQLGGSAAGFTNVRVNSDTTSELHNEEQIQVSPLADSVLLGVWRDFRLGHREVGIGVSLDGGATWSDSLYSTLPYELTTDPVLTYDGDGNFYALFLNYEDLYSGLFVLRSTDNGSSWSDFSIVSLDRGEDKEWIAVDRTDGPYHGNVYVTWTDFWEDYHIRPIRFSRSTDGGATFSPMITINTPGSVQWSVPVVTAAGVLFVAWVADDPKSIRYTRSLDGGSTFDPEEVLFNTSIYSGYITPWYVSIYPYPAMDADLTGGAHNGNLYMVFADKRDTTDFDMYFTRSLDDGVNWSEPVRINDDPVGDGAEQFHPWINVNPDGVITAVFLDGRVPPHAINNYNLFVTCSFDGGVSFAPNQRVSTVSSYLGNAKLPDARLQSPVKMFPDARAGLLAEYIGVSATTSTIHPMWTDLRNGHQDVYTAAVPIGGHNPELEIPADDSFLTTNPTYFLWAPRLTADSPAVFNLQVAGDSGFENAVVLNEEGLTANYYVSSEIPPLPKGMYYWRVIDELPTGSQGYDIVSQFHVCPHANADFAASPVHCSVGDSVFFENLSFSCESVGWDFGDGYSSSDSDPIHVYDSAGVFSVSLFCYLDCLGEDNSDSVLYADYITVSCCENRGDVDHLGGDNPIDIADLVYLVDFMFSGGPPAPCFDEADIDASGMEPVDIADLVYLVDYMFSEGPAPLPCP